MRIESDDLTRPAVVALVELHLRSAFENSPPDSVFALDLSGLKRPGVTLWTAWEGDDLLAMGGLKQLDPTHGEIKSMRTAPGHQRKGLGAAMLDHLIGEALARSYHRLSLETGNNAPFAPARALYRRAGFVECGPFASYSDTTFSQYFTRSL
jgi:putative acetyltransferase